MKIMDVLYGGELYPAEQVVSKNPEYIGTLCVARVILLEILVDRIHTIEAVAAVYPVTWGLAVLAFFLCYFKGYIETE